MATTSWRISQVYCGRRYHHWIWLSYLAALYPLAYARDPVLIGLVCAYIAVDVPSHTVFHRRIPSFVVLHTIVIVALIAYVGAKLVRSLRHERSMWVFGALYVAYLGFETRVKPCCIPHVYHCAVEPFVHLFIFGVLGYLCHHYPLFAAPLWVHARTPGKHDVRTTRGLAHFPRKNARVA